jgi:hypothetical protein
VLVPQSWRNPLYVAKGNQKALVAGTQATPLKSHEDEQTREPYEKVDRVEQVVQP